MLLCSKYTQQHGNETVCAPGNSEDSLTRVACGLLMHLLFQVMRKDVFFLFTSLFLYIHKTTCKIYTDYHRHNLRFTYFLTVSVFSSIISFVIPLTKHSLFSLEVLILFYSVVSKVFKYSKSTRYLATRWDPPFGMSLKQYMFYAPNQNMHTVMPLLPKLFLITDWKLPCSSLEAEIRLKCLFTAAWSSGADWI